MARIPSGHNGGMNLSKHLERQKEGLLTPSRDPNAVTDRHVTKSAPESGRHSADGIRNPDGFAGADTRGL